VIRTIVTDVVVTRADDASEAARQAAWLEAVARHADRKAFRCLFEHWSPRIRAFMLRSGASQAEAEDLVQDVLTTMWTNAHSYDAAKASPATWIFTIARNRRIDRLRRQARFEPDPADPAFIADDSDGPESVSVENSARAELLEAIATLPEEQRTVLEAFYFAEKPAHRIAEEQDLPLGTVKSRLRLALVRLRKLIPETSAL
jgi:RNA polymerase sigma-70 factor (ECF subfamily)